MQRLFSMFPTGRPGLALLLLRAALGVMLVQGVTGEAARLDSAWPLLAAWAIAIALCAGVFTPVAAVLGVVIELSLWPFVVGTGMAVHVCAMLVAVALAMLGPGGYSVDARLFGRRQVIFPARGDDAGE